MLQIATDSQKLTPIQHRLIESLLVSKTITLAATSIGIDRSTAHRWLQESDFRAAFSDAQKQIIDQGVNRIIGLVDDSITTVDELRKTGTNADSVRLKASLAILELARVMHENLVIGNRLEELGRLVEENE